MSVAAALLLAGACTSSTELEQIRVELAEIQRQLLQLQTATADRSAVETLGESVRSDLDRVARSGADLGEELRQLGARIEALETAVNGTQRAVSSVATEVAASREDLENLSLAIAQQANNTLGSEGVAPFRPPLANDPQDTYQTAYNEYLRGNYDLAIAGFLQFLNDSPGSQLADNAQYWIGECYFHQQKFREAIAEFERIATVYPTSERLASALLRKGYALLELGDSRAAREALRQVVGRFPRTDEAILAQRQLDTLGGAP